MSLPAPDYARLSNLAEDSDVSVAWLVRRAVEDFLARAPSPSEPELPLGAAGGDYARPA